MTNKRTEMLSAEEERHLLDAYLDHGDLDAREKLVLAHMPMISRIARKFASRGTANFKDLNQEAALAFTASIDNFKRSCGTRLSTLGPYYIQAALMRYLMDFTGTVRVGTNLPDKKVFTNMRKLVAEIQGRNGGQAVTDADRLEIAERLGVKLSVVQRMEARVFATDVSISHTDRVSEDDDDRMVTSDGIIAVAGEQSDVECAMDQRMVMDKIRAFARATYEERDLEIVQARLDGDMTPEKYAALTSRYGISVERVRQIQRAALENIRTALVRDGLSSINDIAV